MMAVTALSEGPVNMKRKEPKKGHTVIKAENE